MERTPKSGYPEIKTASQNAIENAPLKSGHLIWGGGGGGGGGVHCGLGTLLQVTNTVEPSIVATIGE